MILIILPPTQLIIILIILMIASCCYWLVNCTAVIYFLLYNLYLAINQFMQKVCNTEQEQHHGGGRASRGRSVGNIRYLRNFFIANA